MELQNNWQLDLDISERGKTYIDKILTECFGATITRFNGAVDPLDQHFGIDGIIMLPSKMQLTFQEKTRRYDIWKLNYRDWTLEFYSNSNRIEGEYFHLCADLYIYGWENEQQNDLEQCYIFIVSPVKLAISNGNLKGYYHSNIQHSTATFYSYKFTDFRKSWIIYEHKPLILNCKEQHYRRTACKKIKHFLQTIK